MYKEIGSVKDALAVNPFLEDELSSNRLVFTIEGAQVVVTYLDILDLLYVSVVLDVRFPVRLREKVLRGFLNFLR